MVHRGSGSHGRALGGGDDSFPNGVEHPHVALPRVHEHLGEVGNHVRRPSAGCNHVVNARILRHVLAHHVHHVGHRFHAVECRTALVGRCRSVRRDTMKAELGRDVGQCAVGIGHVPVAGMPCDRHVHVVEESGAHHVHLARAPFLSRRSIKAERSRNLVGDHPFLHRDGRGG